MDVPNLKAVAVVQLAGKHITSVLLNKYVHWVSSTLINEKQDFVIFDTQFSIYLCEMIFKYFVAIQQHILASYLVDCLLRFFKQREHLCFQLHEVAVYHYYQHLKQGAQQPAL